MGNQILLFLRVVSFVTPKNDRDENKMELEIEDIIKKSPPKGKNIFIIFKILDMHSNDDYCDGKVLYDNKYMKHFHLSSDNGKRTFRIRNSLFKVEKITKEEAFIEMI